MENCKITVIVPTYNVERFLKQCLDSLVNQTYICHKAIVVNDGSKDNSGEIAKEYANKYPDIIKYVEQENKGLGAARNTGLREVDTEYVTFLDSDDWLVPRFMEIINERLEQEREKPDMIFTMPKVYDMTSGLYEDWMDKPLFDEIFKSRSVVVNAKLDNRIYALEPSSCRKIYRTDFLKLQNFAFPEGTKWEDVESHFSLLHAASRCIGEDRVGFCYRINSGGQITSSSGKDRIQIVSVFARILQKAIENDWSNSEIAYVMKMLLSFSKWSMDCISIFYRKELIKYLHELFKAIPKKYLNEYYVTFRVTRKDKMLIRIIRSPFYSILGNAYTYKNGKKVLSKAKRIIRRR